MAEILPCHYFNQIMLQRRSIPITDVIKLANACLTKCSQPPSVSSIEHLQGFLHPINRNLSDVHLLYKHCVDEESGQHLLCLVNTLSNELSRQIPTFNDMQMAYFVKIVSLIMESRMGVISSLDALNAVLSIPNITLTQKQAEDLLTAFERENYVKSNDGSIVLSAYAIAELEPYLIKTYGEIVERCCVCRQICLQGKRCESDTTNCEAKMHNYCHQRIFTDMDQRICPECSNSFE